MCYYSSNGTLWQGGGQTVVCRLRRVICTKVKLILATLMTVMFTPVIHH